MKKYFENEINSWNSKYNDVKTEAIQEINDLRKQYNDQATEIQNLINDNQMKDQSVQELRWKLRDEINI